MDAGVAAGRRNSSEDFGSPGVEADAAPLPQRLDTVEQVQPDVEAACGLERVRLGERVPACDL